MLISAEQFDNKSAQHLMDCYQPILNIGYKCRAHRLVIIYRLYGNLACWFLVTLRESPNLKDLSFGRGWSLGVIRLLLTIFI
ncbi:MAG: hypothetical protein ACK521_03060, partial [bacterium]